MSAPPELHAALAPIQEMLHADGYALEVVNLEKGVLTAKIVATPDACEDCLVPKDTMSLVVQDTLPESSGVIDVVLHYPKDGES